MYNIVMFAYNEEKNIASSLSSVHLNKGKGLNKFYLIANGCTDHTVTVANRVKAQLNFQELEVINITLGDKCNAWNHYMHQLAENVDCHFFIDADVNFSNNCFEKMHKRLTETAVETVAIAGMPLSGRNITFYRSLVIERSCFFGNLYGLKHSFIQRIKESDFTLPIGLNWIDSFLTKAVNTDLQFFKYNLPNRVTYSEGVGYKFSSLSPFHLDDIKLYFNRIARYELGKIQEQYLDEIAIRNWPNNMQAINLQIRENFQMHSEKLSTLKKYLVNKRLNKLLKN